FNTLIDYFCKHGQFENAISALNWMRDENIAADAYTYNIMINGYCKNGEIEKANEMLYEGIQSLKDFPDSSTIASFIDYYCKSWDMEVAEWWVSKMKSFRIMPCLVIFNSLMNGYCKNKNVSKAEKILFEMLKNDIKPNYITLSTLLDGY